MRKEKPKYTVLQNACYTLRVAFRLDKVLPLLLMTGIAAQVLQPLTELLIAPMILQTVEQAAPASRVLLTAGGYGLALMLLTGLRAYIQSASIPGLNASLIYYMERVNHKACTTSYANTLEESYQKRLGRAVESFHDGNSAPNMPQLLSELLTALLGFAIYLVMLSGLHPVLLAAVTVTAALGFFVSRRINEWGYRHREESEEYQRHMRYVSNTVMGNEMGQDIRIFGIGNWLKDIFDSALRLYQGFCGRREVHYLLGSLTETVLAVLRNGLAYDRELAESCLRDAGFAGRLAAMPEGLDTILYKELDKAGVDISGGEAQKIAIARALYKNAPFIILDEPTAALDPVAEAEIYSKFNEIVGDKTAIFISHRLSSCRFCDEIAVFDHGHIVQQGSHETLLRDEAGKYYALWNAQAQYYTQ